MYRANLSDQSLVVDILCSSFDDNKSVNYIIPQDKMRVLRIRKLMAYSFDLCHKFGVVYLNEDKSACALVLFPEKKKTTLQTLILDLQLVFNSTGLRNLKKTLERETKIKAIQPKEEVYYLWFIGVQKDKQKKGLGTALLKHVISDARKLQRPIILETSTIRNLPWYQQNDFHVYAELDLGYKLYFLRRNVTD